MGEIWGAAIAAGASIIGGAMSSRSARKQSKFEAQQAKEMVPLQGLEERRNIAYEMEYQDYMNQLNKQRKAGAFAGLARRMGGSGIAPQIQATRPVDPDANGALGTTSPTIGAGGFAAVPMNVQTA